MTTAFVDPEDWRPEDEDDEDDTVTDVHPIAREKFEGVNEEPLTAEEIDKEPNSQRWWDFYTDRTYYQIERYLKENIA